jgi:glycosyltransferase involved in cell wall biosynthesis
MIRSAADVEAPLFTIATVCRNAEHSIEAAIRSVANQIETGATVEHLIIDGASTDGTLDVLARYPHLRVVSEPDEGIYDAMNKATVLARGEYIAFLNADDWYEAGALSAVADAFRSAPHADIVHGDIRRWVDGAPMDVVRPPAGGGPWQRVLMPLNHPACFVRRDVFARFGRFDTSYRIFADYEWARRVINRGAQLHYRPQVLTNFRMGGVSTVRFAVKERYRVYRASGVGLFSTATAISYSCAAVLRNRLAVGRSR